MKKSQIEAYRKVYFTLADEVGAYEAVCRIAGMEPGPEAMTLLGDWFTARTGQVHDLDPKRTEKAEKLGYKI